jgi:hypothetical protein
MGHILHKERQFISHSDTFIKFLDNLIYAMFINIFVCYVLLLINSIN